MEPAADHTTLIVGLIVMALVVIGGAYYLGRRAHKQQNRAKLEPVSPLVETHSSVPPITKAAAMSERATPGLSRGDIFISYASVDRPIAQALAAALSKEGWSVWWDRTIPPGKSFDEVIEAALAAAKCVVVLWSKTSVTSDWVKVEAADAARRRILIPAIIGIEEVTIPLEFRRLQAADLAGWQGSSQHPGFQSLIGSIADIPGMTGRSGQAAP